MFKIDSKNIIYTVKNILCDSDSQQLRTAFSIVTVFHYKNHQLLLSELLYRTETLQCWDHVKMSNSLTSSRFWHVGCHHFCYLGWPYLNERLELWWSLTTSSLSITRWSVPCSTHKGMLRWWRLESEESDQKLYKKTFTAVKLLHSQMYCSNQWGRPLLAARQNAVLRHFSIGFTFQTVKVRPVFYAVHCWDCLVAQLAKVHSVSSSLPPRHVYLVLTYNSFEEKKGLNVA